MIKKKKKIIFSVLTSAFRLAYWRIAVDEASFSVWIFGTSEWALAWAGYTLEETPASSSASAGDFFWFLCRKLWNNKHDDQQEFVAKTNRHDSS